MVATGTLKAEKSKFTIWVWGSIPPTSIKITHYNTMTYRPDGGIIPPTSASVSLYPPITLNNVTPFWSRFGHIISSPNVDYECPYCC